VRLGLVADTHGLFDPKLARVFEGCGLLLHAGDVAGPAVLEALERIAPVRAVRGNNDLGPFGRSLREVEHLEIAGLRLLLVHEASPRRPAPALRRLLEGGGVDVVVHGHSHRPGASRQGPLLFLNPGSAGPRRFSLPRTACVVTLEGRHLSASWWDLGRDPVVPYGDGYAADL